MLHDVSHDDISHEYIFITCSFVNYSLQQTQEFLKSETFPDTELQDKVHV